MTMARRLMLTLVMAFALTGMAAAADLQRLTQEAQRIANSGGFVTIVWWMPKEWWEAAMRSSPSITPEGRAQLETVMGEYSIFAISRVRTGLATGEATSKADMLSHAKLQIGAEIVEPLSPENVSPGAQAVLAGMKPMFTSMMGKLGQSLELVVYPNKQGERTLLDATKPGGFTYSLFDNTFTWRLPLGSVLPPKIDARSGEEFPGNYDFNPYSGDRLQVKP
jgi:hypothetical protein